MIFMVKCVQEVLPDTHFFFCSVKTLINIILCLLKSVKVQPQQKQLNFPNTSGNFLKRTGHFLGTNLLSFRDKPERLTWYLVVVLGPWRTTNYTTYHWIYDGWFGRGARSFFVLAPSRNRKLRHWNGNFWKRFVFVVLLGATTRRKKETKKGKEKWTWLLERAICGRHVRLFYTTLTHLDEDECEDGDGREHVT